MGQVCRRSTGPAASVVGPVRADERGQPGCMQVLLPGLFDALFFAVRCAHGAVANGTASSRVGSCMALHPGGRLGRSALMLSLRRVPLRQPDGEPEAAVAVATR